MSISFSCPNCAAEYSVGDNLAGKKAKCRECGTSINVPQPALSLDGEDDSLDVLESISTGTVTQAPSPRKMFVPRVAEPEAFAVRDEPQIRQAKAPPTPDMSGPDNFSWVPVALCVAALGLNAYLTFTGLTGRATTALGDNAAAPKPYLPTIATVLLLAICVLVVLAPAMIGAWKLAGKVLNARPPKSIYFRALGLASIAALPIVGAPLLERADNPGLVMAMATLSAVPIAFGAMKLAHRQLTLVAAVAAGAGLVFVGLGAFVTNTVVGTVQAYTVALYDKQVAVAKAAQPATEKMPAVATGRTGGPRGSTPADAATAEKLATAFLQIDTALKRTDATRQLASPLLAEVQARVGDVRAASPTHVILNGIDAKLADYQKAIDALPSETPPDDLKVAAQPAGDWSGPVLGKIVSVYGYDFVPPAGSKIDLSSTDAAGYKWDLGSSATLCVSRTPAAVADQQRPWLIGRTIAAATTSPYRVDAPNGSSVTVGAIGGLTFTRIAPASGSNGQVITYAARSGSDWLTCTVVARPGGDEARTLEDAIKTLHPHVAAAQASDPFDLTDLMDRWPTATPPEQNLIAQHLSGRADAEEAVLTAAGGTSPGPQFPRVLPLLSHIATPKSLPLLWKAYESHAQVEQVRPLLARLDPVHADAIAMAQRDLKSQPPQNILPALAALAAADGDPSRARDVGSTLSDMMDDPAVMMQAIRDDSFEGALMKWGSPETNRKLSKVLDDERGQPLLRHIAMHVLSQSHDKRYAMPLCRWIVKDGRPARDALITLGPVAEPDVMKVLLMNNTDARMTASQVLAKIGGRRSISALEASIQADRDPDYQDQAKGSIEEIKDRLKSTPPVTPLPKTASTPPSK